MAKGEIDSGSTALLSVQTMVSLSTVLCVCDIVAAPIYLLLTAMVLVSVVSPVLRDLSSHGKTRSNVKSSQSNKEQVVGGFNASTIFHRICRFFASNEMFLVNKRLFLHFYVAGLIFTATLWTIGQEGVPRKSILELHRLPVVLLLIHLCRRLYECVYVHAWGNGKMHVGGYFLGLLHYAFVPFIVVDADWCCGKVNAVEYQSLKTTYQMVLGALLCCYGQEQQHAHHKILAQLRKGGARSSLEQYSIPSGRWFSYVSCPHYFAEVLIYAAFAIMLHPLVVNAPSCETLKLIHVPASTAPLLGLRSYKHLVLLVWVTTNLTVSARTSHSWYLNRFGSKYPRHRKAIIPLIF